MLKHIKVQKVSMTPKPPGVKNVISINFSSAMTSSGTAQQLKSEIERTSDLDS